MNSPGLSDEGALPRVNETPPITVRDSMLKNVIGSFRTEGTLLFFSEWQQNLLFKQIMPLPSLKFKTRFEIYSQFLYLYKKKHDNQGKTYPGH
jgi:hypothetical protein